MDLHRFTDSIRVYPNVRTAILFVEGFVATPVNPGEDSALDVLLKATPPVPPHEALEIIRGVAQETAEDAEDEDVRSVAAKAAEQMGHPDFLTYLRGAMGAV